MTLAERLDTLAPPARRAALAMLDEISRPLNFRDLDLALAQANIPRSQRRPMMRVLLSQFDIIVLEPRA